MVTIWAEGCLLYAGTAELLPKIVTPNIAIELIPKNLNLLTAINIVEKHNQKIINKVIGH